MSANDAKKKILMIATGGTIASKRSADGLTPVLTSDELLSYVPVQAMNIDSTNISVAAWLKIENIIEENYDFYDGFVICHGTDTMAYTAAALSYLVQNSPKPVVITGSQKPIDMEITDAKTNLTDSFRNMRAAFKSFSTEKLLTERVRKKREPKVIMLFRV